MRCLGETLVNVERPNQIVSDDLDMVQHGSWHSDFLLLSVNNLLQSSTFFPFDSSNHLI